MGIRYCCRWCKNGCIYRDVPAGRTQSILINVCMWVTRINFHFFFLLSYCNIMHAYSFDVPSLMAIHIRFWLNCTKAAIFSRITEPISNGRILRFRPKRNSKPLQDLILAKKKAPDTASIKKQSGKYAFMFAKQSYSQNANNIYIHV